MEKIFLLIFSILIIIFGIYIISDLSKKNDFLNYQINAKNNVILINQKLNSYCKDPFSSTKFKITNQKEFNIYFTNDKKVCTKDNLTYIYCERTICEVQEKILFNFSDFESEVLCNIEKNINNKLEVICN